MKMNQEEVERRLQTLFAKNEEEELDQDEKTVSKEVDEQYLSVNEAMTTDTPLTSEMEDSEMKRLAKEQEDGEDGSLRAQKMI